MNSGDGVSASDRVSVAAGGHTDYNWAFTAPGDYTMTLRASARLPSGLEITSAPADYRFSVIPEPATGLLVGAGGVTLLLATTCRRGRKERFNVK
jgi:surface-anchored protein